MCSNTTGLIGQFYDAYIKEKLNLAENNFITVYLNT